MEDVDAVLAAAFAGIPHVAVRLCHDRGQQPRHCFVLETETWGPSLNRAVQTSWISPHDQADLLHGKGRTRFDPDEIEAAVDCGDTATVLDFLRHLAEGWADVQRQRAARASALGMRHPGARLDHTTASEALRIDHLSVDVDLVTILKAQDVDVAHHTRYVMPRMHDPHGIVSDPWMGDEDDDLPSSISDDTGAMVIEIQATLKPGVTYDGDILKIAREIGGDLPESMAAAATGRPLHDMIHTGTDLDWRRVLRIDLEDGWIKAKLAPRLATMGDLGLA